MTTTHHTQDTNQPRRLGIDIGRVIIDGSSHPQGGDTAFFQGDEATMLATPEMPGAIDAITRLVEQFDGQAWLVSKCGERVQHRSLRWLANRDFFGRTGIPEANTRFCKKRPEKRIHAVDLGLTHFIDDKLDVHEAIEDVVEHRFLFGPQRRPAPDFVTHVVDWQATERAVLLTL